MLDIFPSLTDGEWTISAELFNQGHGCVIQYSPSLALESLCGWDGWVGCSNWVPFCPSLKLDRTGLRQDKHLLKRCIRQCGLGRIGQVAIWISVTVTSWRGESSNVSLVILDKLLFVLSKPLFLEIRKQWQTYWHTDREDLTSKSSNRQKNNVN